MAVRERIDVVLVTGDPTQGPRLAAALRAVPGVDARVRVVSAIRHALAVLAPGSVDAVVVDLDDDGGEPAGLESLRTAAGGAVMLIGIDPGAPRADPLRLIEAGHEVIARHDPRALALAVLSAVGRRGSGDSAQRLAAIVDSSEDAIIGKRLDGTITSWNPGAERIYGYGAPEVVGRPITLLACSPEQVSEFDTIIERVARGERVSHFDTTRRRADGTVITVSISVSPIRDRSGAVVGASTVARDISEPTRAHARMLSAETRFRRAFEDSPTGMALLSMDGRIEQANAAFGRLCEAVAPSLTGVKLVDLVHPADRDEHLQALRELTRGAESPVRLELRFTAPGREVMHLAVSGTRLTGCDGRRNGLLYAFQNVTERKTYEERLRFLADHDSLTDLCNRRRFEEEFASHLTHVGRYGPEGALLLLDIDDFKSVNDSLGHHAGDELIVAVAGVLRGRMRSSDVVARVGGDEFAVLLPKGGRQDAVSAAEAIEAALHGCGELPGGRPLSASIGIVVFTADGPDGVAAHMVAADTAMYAAKAAGGDGHVIHAGQKMTTAEPPVEATRP